jgi:hypothetical protein
MIVLVMIVLIFKNLVINVAENTDYFRAICL